MLTLYFRNSYADFLNYVRQKKNKTYICKPDSGCQGRGIFLTKNPLKDIKPGDNYVAQVYVSRVRILLILISIFV
jgi:tubulin polyglutamylase TTLL6/13